MKVRPGAVVRGTGVAIACLAGDASKRSPILLAGFAGGWFLDRPGLQIFAVVPDTEEPWKRTTVPFATGKLLARIRTSSSSDASSSMMAPRPSRNT